MANWFRYKENQTSNTKKGSFDLRKITIIPKEELQNKQNKEEFAFKMKYKNKSGIDDEKKITFRSDYFNSLSHKSVKDIFEQIKKYYSLIKNLFRVKKVDYKKLKFISDPNIINLELSRDDVHPDTIKSIIENIDWHLNLKRVNLKGIDKSNVNRFFTALNLSSNLFLESITIDSTTQTIEFDPQANNTLLLSLKTFFSKKCCARLTEFNLIDVKIQDIKIILDILRLKFIFIKKHGKIVQLSEEELKDCNKSSTDMKLPFTKLTFKKAYDNINSMISIDLMELYLFFKDMAVEFDNKFENIFECLDISGAECYNMEGLKYIINNFKIIKDLNISGTKYIVNNLKYNNTSKEKYSQTIKAQPKANSGVNINSFLINCLELIKSINYNEVLDNDYYGRDIQVSAFKRQQTNFVFSNIEPLITNIYALETPVSTEAFYELLQLFKRLKFIRGIHLSDHLITVINPIGDYIKFNNVVSDVRKEDEYYCENFFDVEYS